MKEKITAITAQVDDARQQRAQALYVDSGPKQTVCAVTCNS